MTSADDTKSIVITIHRLTQGGIDRVACILASGFARAGYRVTLMIFSEGGDAVGPMRALIDDDVTIVLLSKKARRRAVDLWSNLQNCASALHRLQPDFILSSANNMNWITVAAAMLSRCNAKVALKTTNPIIRKNHKWLKRTIRSAIYNFAFQKADVTLVLSDAERRELQGHFPRAANTLRTVANPYVTPAMLADTDMPSPFPGKKIVLGVGRFEKQKRFDLLIRAFARVTDTDTHLVILGEGPLKAECAALASALGLDSRVSMPGYVTDPSAYYIHANIFALTSVFEGLPAVVLEALAASCPVVSTDCFPAARDLLLPLAGCHVVDPPTDEAIAHHIDLALTSPPDDDLRSAAMRYSLQNGIADHIAAMEAA